MPSIQKVETILWGACTTSMLKNQSSISVNSLASAYGAYIGEVIRRSEPSAKWERDDSVGGESLTLSFGEADTPILMAWCYRLQVVKGSEDNVWVKYQVLKDQRSKSPAPETK